MYRYLIQDFLSQKRELLNKYQFSHLELCLLGRLKLTDISKLRLKNDEVIVYLSKEPRIYEKIYDFSTLSQTIVDLVLYTKESVYLRKSDFTSTMIDPFYLKDLRLQSFESLWVIPIMNDNDIEGVALFYFNSFAKEFKISSKELEKLFLYLQVEEGQKIEKTVNQAIFKNEKYQKIIFSKDLCYIDSSIKKSLRLSSNILELENNHQLKRKIEREIKQKYYQYCACDGLDIYYHRQYELDKIISNHDFLALEMINDELLTSFTLIVIEKVIEESQIYPYLLDYSVKKYYVSPELICYKINEEITKTNEKLIDDQCQKGYHIILTSKTIGHKMNLYNLITYIKEMRPETWKLDDYTDYIENLAKIKLYADFNHLTKTKTVKTLINSVDQKMFGMLPSLVDLNLEKTTAQNTFHIYVDKLIQEMINQQSKSYIIPLIPMMFNSQKTINKLKRLIQEEVNVKILIINPNPQVTNQQIDMWEMQLAKMKELGFYIIMDSSIYFNYQTIHLLELADGVFLKENEYISLIRYPLGINSAIFQYMIENYKELIIDYEINKVKEEYINRLFYYRKDE